MLHVPTAEDLTALAIEFGPHLLHNELTISGHMIRFPSIVTGSVHSPGDWLVDKHGMTPVHEPAMVTWLFNLGRATEEERIAFFDVGAAYGYFALLAGLAFARVEIIAVEPNPLLADYIAKVARLNNRANFHVVNELVSDRSGSARLNVRNYVYLPEGIAASPGFEGVDVAMTTLKNLLSRSVDTRPILKIDVEGWQAKMLPPAVDELAKRRSVILLECDWPEKVRHFDATDADLAGSFLSHGYRLFLSDHRRPDFEVAEITKPGDVSERDALLVMIPPDLSIA